MSKFLLISCPFCGNRSVRVVTNRWGDKTSVCQTCNYELPYNPTIKAHSWNRT